VFADADSALTSIVSSTVAMVRLVWRKPAAKRFWRSHGRALGLEVEFVVADAPAMPFNDDDFDGARVERALQHMADPAAVVSEMARVVGAHP
jgi:ubiquinone/menaquinone biosynthesis C-methylase UbiE